MYRHFIEHCTPFPCYRFLLKFGWSQRKLGNYNQIICVDSLVVQLLGPKTWTFEIIKLREYTTRWNTGWFVSCPENTQYVKEIPIKSAWSLENAMSSEYTTCGRHSRHKYMIICQIILGLTHPLKFDAMTPHWTSWYGQELFNAPSHSNKVC